MKLLKHFGMSSNDVDIVRRDYAHVLGTVKLCNLPNVMRASGLHEWFIEKIKDGNHILLVSFVTNNSPVYLILQIRVIKYRITNIYRIRDSIRYIFIKIFYTGHNIIRYIFVK